jgi:hypothetical protein
MTTLNNDWQSYAKGRICSLYCYAECYCAQCHNAECCYAECRYTECRGPLFCKVDNFIAMKINVFNYERVRFDKKKDREKLLQNFFAGSFPELVFAKLLTNFLRSHLGKDAFKDLTA